MTPVIHILNQYLLIVDETIQQLGHCWELFEGQINLVSDDIMSTNKIVAHLPLNGSSELEGVPLLPELPKEDYVKLSIEATNNQSFANGEHEKIVAQIYFRKGYRAASQTKKYSEEDMREAIAEAWNTCEDNEDDEIFTQVFNRIIQSLSQPKIPIGFEFELEQVFNSQKQGFNMGAMSSDVELQVKTVPNQQGKPVAQGKWIFKS